MVYRRRGNYRRKRPTGKRNTVRKAYAKKRNTNIKKQVKKVLGTLAETKVLQFAGTIDCRTIQSGTTQTQFEATTICLTPQGSTISGFNMGYPILSNGVGQDQRIGDEVKIKGSYIKYLLTAKPYNITFNPTPKAVLANVWCIKPKTQNAFGLACNQIQTNSNAIFYENQTNLESGMAGTLNDMIRAVDKDNFQVLYFKQHKLGYAGTLNSSNVVASSQNNDFHQFAMGKFKIPSYIWKVSRTELMQGRNIYFFVQILNADNTLAGASELPVSCAFNESIYFTDM